MAHKKAVYSEMPEFDDASSLSSRSNADLLSGSPGCNSALRAPLLVC
jgi:hypothetical protein